MLQFGLLTKIKLLINQLQKSAKLLIKDLTSHSETMVCRLECEFSLFVSVVIQTFSSDR